MKKHLRFGKAVTALALTGGLGVAGLGTLTGATAAGAATLVPPEPIILTVPPTPVIKATVVVLPGGPIGIINTTVQVSLVPSGPISPAK
jgi:hypothetical protein